MGLGTLTLISDGHWSPERLLDSFNSAGSPVFVRKGPLQSANGVREWQADTDCGVTMYCSFCGELLCVGCGDAPTIYVGEQDAAACCTRDECTAAFREFRDSLNVTYLSAA